MDQSYIRTLSGYQGNHKFFWLVENEDYKEWNSAPCGKGEDCNRQNQRTNHGTVAPVLVLKGLSHDDLESTMSHVYSLQEKRAPSLPSLLLHFFGRSVREIQRPQTYSSKSDEWWNVLCINTLLWQVIHVYSEHEQCLLLAFVNKIWSRLGANELSMVLTDPPEIALSSLLGLADIDSLWAALVQTLIAAAKIDPRNTSQTPVSLTFILEANDPPWRTWMLLIDNIRSAIRNLGDVFSPIRVLVSNPPETASLELQPSTEVLLEHDKERKGLCLPKSPTIPRKLN